MKNEFGEKISQNDLDNFTQRISNLSDWEVDTLWFNCGFICSDREIGQRALRKSDLLRLRKSFFEAKNIVSSLLLEVKICNFLNELEKLEN